MIFTADEAGGFALMWGHVAVRSGAHILAAMAVAFVVQGGAEVSPMTNCPAVETGRDGLLVFKHHSDDTVIVYVPWHFSAHEGDEGHCRFSQFADGGDVPFPPLDH